VGQGVIQGIVIDKLLDGPMGMGSVRSFKVHMPSHNRSGDKCASKSRACCWWNRSLPPLEELALRHRFKPFRNTVADGAADDAKRQGALDAAAGLRHGVSAS